MLSSAPLQPFHLQCAAGSADTAAETARQGSKGTHCILRGGAGAFISTHSLATRTVLSTSRRSFRMLLVAAAHCALTAAHDARPSTHFGRDKP